MSLPFSDTTNLNGILQLIEREIGFEPGDITGNATRLKQFTADVNLAWADYLSLALPASGTWQYDDSNHTDYPFIKTALVAGQRDYTFTSDQQGNLILDIFKVAILPSADATLYQEIRPVDQQTRDHAPDMVAENPAQGVPLDYDKTGNGIILGTIPDYTAPHGLKVYINREASHFTTSDTDKKPGCPGLHHEYFVLKPAHRYARRNTLKNAPLLERQVLLMEQSITEYFSKRERDERHRITPKITPYL